MKDFTEQIPSMKLALGIGIILIIGFLITMTVIGFNYLALMMGFLIVSVGLSAFLVLQTYQILVLLKYLVNKK